MIKPVWQCASCKQEIVGQPAHCPACDADLTRSGALERVEDRIPAWMMSRPLREDIDSAEHMTGRWVRLLDVFTPRGTPSRRLVVRRAIAAVCQFLFAFSCLGRGATEFFVLMLGGSIINALDARKTYLEVVLEEQNVRDVWWYAMPSLTRRASPSQQELLAQWRRATIVQLVVAGVSLVLITALVAERIVPAW